MGVPLDFGAGYVMQILISQVKLSVLLVVLTSEYISKMLRQDVRLLTEDIAELKPSVFCAVPRVLDRIYGGIIQTVPLI